MKYTTKKCPKCGNTYAWREASNVEHYGSPIRRCNKCGSTFIDKDYKEIAIEGYNETFIAKVQPFSIISLIIGFILIIAAIFLFAGDSRAILFYILGGLFFVGGIWFIIGDIKDHEKRIEEYERLKKASEDRLSNTEYAKLLDELGYSVPAKYLFPEKFQRK